MSNPVNNKTRVTGEIAWVAFNAAWKQATKTRKISAKTIDEFWAKVQEAKAKVEQTGTFYRFIGTRVD